MHIAIRVGCLLHVCDMTYGAQKNKKIPPPSFLSRSSMDSRPSEEGWGCWGRMLGEEEG